MPEQERIKCSQCTYHWKNLDEFLDDDSLVFIGYQPFFKSPEKSSFLFTHDKQDCGTTLFVDVLRFKKLLKSDVKFAPFKPTNEPDCEKRCINSADLAPCRSKNCNGRVIRDLMQTVKQYVQTPTECLSEDEIDNIINE